MTRLSRHFVAGRDAYDKLGGRPWVQTHEGSVPSTRSPRRLWLRVSANATNPLPTPTLGLSSQR